MNKVVLVIGLVFNLFNLAIAGLAPAIALFFAVAYGRSTSLLMLLLLGGGLLGGYLISKIPIYVFDIRLDWHLLWHDGKLDVEDKT